jgi:hypothetical protein
MKMRSYQIASTTAVERKGHASLRVPLTNKWLLTPMLFFVLRSFACLVPR